MTTESTLDTTSHDSLHAALRQRVNIRKLDRQCYTTCSSSHDGSEKSTVTRTWKENRTSCTTLLMVYTPNT
eukprot:4603462-Amphidinium_carterae.1